MAPDGFFFSQREHDPLFLQFFYFVSAATIFLPLQAAILYAVAFLPLNSAVVPFFLKCNVLVYVIVAARKLEITCWGHQRKGAESGDVKGKLVGLQHCFKSVAFFQEIESSTLV